MKWALCLLLVSLFIYSCIERKKQDDLLTTIESSEVDKRKPTKLFNAIYSNDIDAVGNLITDGIDINKRDENGCTPLLAAFQHDNLEIINILIDAGADVNAKYKKPKVEEHEIRKGVIVDLDVPFDDGETALHWVVKVGDSGLAQLLITNGACLDSKDTKGQTPLVEAVLNGNLELVKLLVKKGADIYYRDNDGRTLLHMITNDLQILLDEGNLIKYLIVKGINPNSVDNNGVSPLHIAAMTGENTLARILIENGANVNLINNNGCTPLDFALKEKQPDIIMLLNQHGSKALKEEPTDIAEAVMLGDVDKIRNYISEGKEINKEYIYGNAALHYVAIIGNVDMAKLLISFGAHIDKKNNIDHTPLFEAVFHNNLSICRLLIENGADINVKVNSGRETPLDYAMRINNKEMVEFLKQHGAKTINELQEEEK